VVAKNDITGDSIQSKGASDAYRDNYDRIFRNKDNTGTDKSEFQDVLSTEDCVIDALEEYKRQAQDLWNDSCTTRRSK
jgi:hypothetical protein